MEYKITNSEFAPVANIKLNKGDKVKIERGGMIMKSQGVDIKGKMNGKGLLRTIGRALTSGESVFITEAESGEREREREREGGVGRLQTRVPGLLT